MTVTKPKLNVAFSGGRTSAVMTALLWGRYKDTHDLIITFANTGCEHHETYEFVHNCERHFGWPVVWLEAEVNPERGKGVRHKIVDYHTASRRGEPFEAVVAKYGLFNMTSPACTARLKTDVMNDYLKSKGRVYGKKLNHETAIGIRADEMDRVSVNKAKFGYLYPLVDEGITKREVGRIIKETWPFDLQIPHDAFGNCTWCWKKSKRKHLTLAQQDPSVFDFPERMEREYGHVNGDTAAAKDGRRYWFRKHQTVADIRAEAKTTEFIPYVDDPYEHGVTWAEELDVGAACGESCEIGADD